jgi:general secretion pathway protein M
MSSTSWMNPLRQRWQGLNTRERQLVSLAGAALASGLLWLLLITPAWQTWREVPAKARLLEVDQLQMQRLATEAKELKAQPPVNAAQSAEALKAATDRLGAVGKLSLIGDRATLTLTGASPAQLGTWLGEVRAGARARPVDAQLQRVGNGLQGTVVVNLSGGGA